MNIWKIFARLPAALEDSDDYAELCYRYGVIAVGWSEIGDLAQYDGFEEIKNALRVRFSRRLGGNERRVGAWAASLWHFKASVREGDVVLCPDRKARVIYVGRIESDRPFYSRSELGGECGFAHRRRVRWFRTLNAREVRAIGRLGGLQTVSRITRGAERVKRLLRRRLPTRVRRLSHASVSRPDPVWGREAERRAMEWLRARGEVPRDVATRNFGWDIETDDTKYEVKGRKSLRTQIVLSDNEWRAAQRYGRRYVLLIFTASSQSVLRTAIPIRRPNPTGTCLWTRRIVYEYVLN